MKVRFLFKDQRWATGATVYWFDLGGERYGVIESGPSVEYVDDEGFTLNGRAGFADVQTKCVVTNAMRAA